MADNLSHAEVLGRYCGTFVDELVAAGVENVCLCPGSRSTPLALTFARHPGIKLWTHLDERSCAYFALGMAKAYSIDPVVILCSSGTAAANFLPAVVEAYHSHAPLIVLTADRPPELQGLGSNQTIDQQNLYGSAAKWFVNMPLPEASEHMLRYVRMVADRTVETAREKPWGPVHLNFPFREPLLPASFEFTVTESARTPRVTSTFAADTMVPWEIEPGDRALIVAGPSSLVYGDNLLRLARRVGAPVLADPLSQERFDSPKWPEIITTYDAFLRSPTLVEAMRPSLILRFGDPPTSKPLATYLAHHKDTPQIVVTQPGTWPDPDLTASQIVYAESWEFCDSLLSALGEEPASLLSGWLTDWQRINSAAGAAMHSVIEESSRVTEPSVITDLAEILPELGSVVAGNSMPVRDIDSFFPASERGHRVFGNRGASGIDGVVSTAMGVAARAYGRVVLVIGDLSFYHDMNGLLAAQRFGLSATIVLINNDGGGIFSFLPQHEDAEHFETLFGTPHGLDFSHVAGLYGVGFQRVTTREEYRKALKASFDAPGVQVIEIKTDREENLRLHQRIWDEVAKAVEPLVTGEVTP